MRALPGRWAPLGATWDGMGVNFAVFSENTTKVELCLFDAVSSRSESERIELVEYTNQVWHVYLPDARPGQLYAYRMHGPYDPERGMRFNPNKIVLDPYAKAIGRDLTWNDSLFGYRIGSDDLAFNDEDSAAFAPLAVVVDEAFTWGDDHPPRIPWHETIIYETHVKGLTMLHPEVPEELRGTFTGLSSEPVMRYLRELGVTTLELMPVHHCVSERHLVERGLGNYWGYNTLSFFAPDLRFASRSAGYSRADQVRDFKMMVRSLHAAGIEVILDVVYNHTPEGNHLGPHLSFKGFDNAAYYRLSDESKRFYIDFTGCGNSLNMRHPRVLQLIMDSLRYWVLEMRVDGFRFDLASALARELYEVDKLGAFFDIIQQDPIISQVKLIAEPWDIGEGGYQVGNFPVLWTEWNGRYRDTMRQFWRGEHGRTSDFATRLTGSSDLYGHSGRRPYASINFVTCHDGFTLQDLVSYNEKRNEANGESNADGANDNYGWNCGSEGETSDPAVLSMRERQKRNLMATLLLSTGVPMISGGDELSRTQNGNNNAYCHDNELNWYYWSLSDSQRDFLEFTKRMIELRRSAPVLQRRKFFIGNGSDEGEPEIVWHDLDGGEMSDRAWHEPERLCLGVRFLGHGLNERNAYGEGTRSDTYLVLFNAAPNGCEFVLPVDAKGRCWEHAIDTSLPTGVAPPARLLFGDRFVVPERSISIFKLIEPQEES